MEAETIFVVSIIDGRRNIEEILVRKAFDGRLWEFGRFLTCRLSGGKESAKADPRGSATCGAGPIKELSSLQSKEFGKGFSPVNLSLMRKLYLVRREFPEGKIFQTASEISGEGQVLTRDMEGVALLSKEGHLLAEPADMLKEPYVLEFLGLEGRERYSEAELEGAIITRLEHFLLEMLAGIAEK